MTRTKLLLAGIAVVAAIASQAFAQSVIWYIWANGGTIGVAASTYSAPGWTPISGPYATDSAAWAVACDLHYSGAYNSPDIAAGRIFC